MSGIDLDFDTQMNNLEREWREVYDESVVARAEYQALIATGADALQLAALCRQLERAEAKKTRIMAKIERLEDTMLSN